MYTVLRCQIKSSSTKAIQIIIIKLVVGFIFWPLLVIIIDTDTKSYPKVCLIPYLATSLPIHPILSIARDKCWVYAYTMLAPTMEKQYSHSTSSFIIIMQTCQPHGEVKTESLNLVTVT